MARPTTSSSHKKLPFVIAVTGCDGAGKSTLSKDLQALLASSVPVEWLYLGQSSGNIARWVETLPLVGFPLKRYLKNKAERAQGEKAHTPGVVTMLVIFILSQWRAHKFRRMLRFNRRSVVVVTDRYPQAEVPGFHFDGAGLGAVNTHTWLGRTLAAREKRLYQWMASHIPALIIRLNIDADTAHFRKPDHKLSILQDKVAILPELRFNGAQILDLDGRDPYDQVLDTALRTAKQVLDSPPASHEQ